VLLEEHAIDSEGVLALSLVRKMSMLMKVHHILKQRVSPFMLMTVICILGFSACAFLPKLSR
jgi:hypothetical protein